MARRLVATGLLLVSLPVRAAMLDQVRPFANPGEVATIVHSRVQIFNDAATGLSLAGHSLHIAAEIETVLALPAIVLPPQCYLDVELGPGTSEFDLTDSTFTYFTGDVRHLQPEAGEVGLFGPSGLIDFVAWGSDSSTFGAAYGAAVAAGQWPLDAYVDMSVGSVFAELGRIPSGYDRDLVGDWQVLERQSVIPLTPHNPLQLSPRDGIVVQSSVVNLSWRAVPGATSYRVQVAQDSLFQPPLALNVAVAGTSHAFAPADGAYYWRVLPAIPSLAPSTAPQGAPPSDPARPWAKWRFDKGQIVAGPDVQIDEIAGFPQLYQHKDSKMLCVYNSARRYKKEAHKARPGCVRASGVEDSGPWDGVHRGEEVPLDEDAEKHIMKCKHCGMYCTRASIQMVNKFYGGTVKQDEISYRVYRNSEVGPEIDEGHGMGAIPDSPDGERTDKKRDNTYEWALKIAPDAPAGSRITRVNVAGALTPAQWVAMWQAIQAEIKAGRPVLVAIWTTNGGVATMSHCVVYTKTAAAKLGDQQRDLVWIQDPWPGLSDWYDIRAVGNNIYFKLPANIAMGAGRAFDPMVTADADGDGIVDFDERDDANAPLRRFQSRKDKADTDEDQIADKAEIQNLHYHVDTHGSVHNTPGNTETAMMAFADVDRDGLRAEVDRDTDCDAKLDADEDCDLDGVNPEDNGACAGGANERCVFRVVPNPCPKARQALCGGPEATPGRVGSTRAGQVTAQQVVTVTVNAPVTDVNATVSVVHDHVGDLELRLRSPSGTVVALSLGNGGDGDDYASTTFDDSAATSITAGSAPFAASFRPEELLAAFAGEPAAGDWVLEMVDVVAPSTGSILSLCLDIETFAGPVLGTGETEAGPMLRPLLYPNPCGAVARMAFTMRAAGRARLRVFDPTGRLAATWMDEWLPAGDVRRRFATDLLAPGMYFWRLETPAGVESGPLIHLER